MQRRPASYPMEPKAPVPRAVVRDPVLRAVTAALLFGLATPASKLLLRNLDPLALAGWLYLGAALGVAPVVLRRPRLRPPTDPKDRRLLLGAVFFGGMLGPIALLLGLRLASAASVSLWLNLELVATALIGVVFFKDHLGRWAWVAVAGVLAAGILLAVGEGRFGILAGLLVAMACVFWGIDNHLTALIASIGPAETTFWKGLVAGLLNLALASLVGPTPVWWGAVPLALILGTLSYGASITLYIGAARELGATRAQLVFASAPFFGLFFSVVALGEDLAARHVVATALFGGSILLLLFERHAHAHRHAALTHAHAHRHDDGHHAHLHPDLPPDVKHTHEHAHEEITHAHPHLPDLHHRHDHSSDEPPPDDATQSA